MKLDKQRVLNLFAMFCDLDGSELSDWSGLCEAAGIKLTSRLRENADVPRHMERLCTAVAACAYFDYTMLRGSSDSNIKVGDISIASGGKNDAESIRDYFLADISDLIEAPVGFAFTSAETRL